MKTIRTLVALGITVGLVQGAPVTGRLWAVSNAVASDATPANVPGTAPDVTFDVNAPLNFTVPGTVNQFLLSGGALNIVGSAAALSSAISPSLIEFTGLVSVINGQTFTVTHDDGLTLTIGGLAVISTPGPTGPVQTTQTYTGPSGDFPFTLVYGECCGGSAVLQIDLPFRPSASSVPEPAAAPLAISGCLLLGFLKLRFALASKYIVSRPG